MAKILKPEEFPILGIDSHLPAVDRSELSADALRRRFMSPPPWHPEFVAEKRFQERHPAHASVLIPLVRRQELMVLLTQRTEHLNDHPGQISFPGGRAESHDADATATAMREALEEIGLPSEHAEVLGNLSAYTTGTGFVVTPVVALITPEFKARADPFEVAEVFEVPLSFLTNPQNHRRHSVDWRGERREFLSMPWEGMGASGHRRNFFIWGATAAMIRNFYRFLSA